MACCAPDLSRRTLQDGAQSRHRAQLRVSLDAEPIHGLRASLHPLLRQGLRTPGRAAERRPLRPIDPGENQRRRCAPARTRAQEPKARIRRHRHGDRPITTGRGILPADARLPRRARSAPQSPEHHHPRAAYHPRYRPDADGLGTGGRERELLRGVWMNSPLFTPCPSVVTPSARGRRRWDSWPSFADAPTLRPLDGPSASAMGSIPQRTGQDDDPRDCRNPTAQHTRWRRRFLARPSRTPRPSPKGCACRTRASCRWSGGPGS